MDSPDSDIDVGARPMVPTKPLSRGRKMAGDEGAAFRRGASVRCGSFAHREKRPHPALRATFSRFAGEGLLSGDAGFQASSSTREPTPAAQGRVVVRRRRVSGFILDAGARLPLRREGLLSGGAGLQASSSTRSRLPLRKEGSLSGGAGFQASSSTR
jgi:hypothetical protein